MLERLKRSLQDSHLEDSKLEIFQFCFDLHESWRKLTFFKRLQLCAKWLQEEADLEFAHFGYADTSRADTLAFCGKHTRPDGASKRISHLDKKVVKSFYLNNSNPIVGGDHLRWLKSEFSHLKLSQVSDCGKGPSWIRVWSSGCLFSLPNIAVYMFWSFLFWSVVDDPSDHLYGTRSANSPSCAISGLPNDFNRRWLIRRFIQCFTSHEFAFESAAVLISLLFIGV